MKVALIGATGKAGSQILQVAEKRNLDLTAIVRHPEKLPVGVPFLKKDLFDLTPEDLKDFSVVVDAFNAPLGKEELHEASIKHLVKILAGSPTRLIVVGGASSLFLDPEKTTRMIDASPIDAPYYPTAYHMYQAFRYLSAVKDLVWTYISPAAYFNPRGKATGTYGLSDDYLQKNAAGKSEISMADYAEGLVDEIMKPQHLKEHISFYGK